MRPIFTIFFVLTLILAFFGASVISFAAHELKHYYDVKDKVDVQEVCLFNLPIHKDDLKTGVVRYPAGTSADSSELSASFIQFLTLGLLAIPIDGFALMLLLENVRRLKHENKNQ